VTGRSLCDAGCRMPPCRDWRRSPWRCTSDASIRADWQYSACHPLRECTRVYMAGVHSDRTYTWPQSSSLYVITTPV